MKPSEDELISRIKKTMASYEEPYLPGAWEKFNESTAKEKKRLFGFYQVLNIAAMLLVCAFVFLYVDKVVEKPKSDVVKKKTAPVQRPQTEAELTPGALGDEIGLPELDRSIYTAKRKSTNQVLDSAMNTALAQQYAYRAVDSAALQQLAVLTAPEQNIQLQNMVGSRRMQLNAGPALRSKLPVPTISARPDQANESSSRFESFLQKEQVMALAKSGPKENTAKLDKWEMGLVVAPSIANNNKLNLGYGVSMGYALSKKVSVVSGISYNDMNASNQVPAAPVNTAAFFSGEAKNLQSVEASVSGIDIPLGIKYNLSKKVYANVGVSAFAVLNERKNNTYIQERSMQTVSSDPGTAGEMRIVVMNQRITEKAPDASLGDKYIGFYNFSFGVKQPLSKKNSLSFEPFVKLPMKETSADNLKLIGTGIKLKLDF